jgi:hypothetical protein
MVDCRAEHLMRPSASSHSHRGDLCGWLCADLKVRVSVLPAPALESQEAAKVAILR